MSMQDPGAPPPGGDPGAGGGPEALLAQIRMLLDQYLAMGDQTPVAPEAQQLAQAIDQTMGGGPPGADQGQPPPDQGAPPPGGLGDLGGPPPDAGGMPGPDQMLPQEGEPPANPGAKTFGEANKSASERLKKRNKSKG